SISARRTTSALWPRPARSAARGEVLAPRMGVERALCPQARFAPRGAGFPVLAGRVSAFSRSMEERSLMLADVEVPIVIVGFGNADDIAKCLTAIGEQRDCPKVG